MKDFVIGFLCCLVLVLITAATPRISNRYKGEQDVWKELENVYTEFQTKQFKIYLTTPNVNTIRKGEIVIVASTTVNLFTRINESTYSVALQK